MNSQKLVKIVYGPTVQGFTVSKQIQDTLSRQGFEYDLFGEEVQFDGQNTIAFRSNPRVIQAFNEMPLNDFTERYAFYEVPEFALAYCYIEYTGCFASDRSEEIGVNWDKTARRLLYMHMADEIDHNELNKLYAIMKIYSQGM